MIFTVNTEKVTFLHLFLCFTGIRDWYKTTHSVSPQASATDMAEIMEAYWNLSSKRFIDNCCMMTDADLLGDLPARLQDEMYEFLGDDQKMEVNFCCDCNCAGRIVYSEMHLEKILTVVF